MQAFLPALVAFSLLISSSLALAADNVASPGVSAPADLKDVTDSETEAKKVVVDEATAKLSKGEQTQLELLENHFFGRVHPSEVLDRRIERLERFVFGIAASGTEYGARLDKLSATLSTVDPDGKKRVISIAPPTAPPEAGLPNVVNDTRDQPMAPTAVTRADSNGPSSSSLPTSGVGPREEITPQTVAGMTGADNAAEDNKTKEDFYKVAPVMASSQRPSLAGQVKSELHQGEVAGVLHCNKSLFPIDGEPVQVMHELSLAIKVHPLDPELMFERAKAEMLLDKIDNALSDLSDAIMNNPNRSLYYLARAWCYKRSGNSVLANDDLKQAKFVDPGLPAKIDFLPSTANSEASKTQ
ncbi:MAG: hypothetical protein P4L53_08515 [Candidatus Obscuribacterales bacterium]|nr:hypothetical protein [Candidatus Obscuribacterales bacterium]